MQKLAALIIIATLAGMCCIVTGVYLLAGVGWAFVASGAALVAAAALLRNGLKVADV